MLCHSAGLKWVIQKLFLVSGPGRSSEPWAAVPLGTGNSVSRNDSYWLEFSGPGPMDRTVITVPM